MVHEEGPGDGLGIPAELSGIGQPVPAESPLPPLYQAAGEADPVPGPVASPQAPAAETLGGPADLEPAATIAERGVQAAGGEEPDPDETAAELTTTGSEPPKPVREDTALTPGRQPATTVPEPAQPPEKTPGRVVPQPRAAEAAQPDPDETAAQPPAVPTVIAAHDRLEVAANAKGGNGSGDGASRQPGRHERPGEPDRGDGEAGRTGSDGPGGGGPETPSSGEFDPENPSELATSVAHRFTDDVLEARDIAGGTLMRESVLGSGGLTSSMRTIIGGAYIAFVDDYLAHSGRPVTPATIADLILSIPGVNRHIEEGLGPNRPLAFLRELTEAIILIQVARWNEGAILEKDSLEFARIYPAAKNVAAAHNVPVHAVFDDPRPGQEDLHAKAFQETYPLGPIEYVAERMEATSLAGYARTRREAHYDALVGEAIDDGSIDLDALATVSASNILARSYLQRLLTGTEYDAFIQRRLEINQQLAATFTLAKLEKVWGSTAAFGLPEEQREWLIGEKVGSPELLPLEDRSLLEGAEWLEKAMITAVKKTILSENEMGALARQAGIRIARAGYISDEDIVEIAHVLDIAAKNLAPGANTDTVSRLQADDNSPEANEVRLGYDARVYNTLGASYVNARLYETGINPDTGRRYNPDAIGTYRANALREALVLREIRLLYPQLFPRQVQERAATDYYRSRHFYHAQRIVQTTAEAYFYRLLHARYNGNV